MGCVSSKLVKKEIKRDILLNNGGDYINHVVSLKSSTYGVLKLDNELQQQQQQQQKTEEEEIVVSETKKVQNSPSREEPEVINAWELMEDLEEDGFVKRSPKSRGLFKGEKEVRSPLKFLNQIGSPLKMKRFGGGKENKGRVNNGKSDFSPKSILRVNNSLKLSYPVKSTRALGFEGGDSGFSSRRRSFSPLFDPELVALYEKELSEEEEQIKRIISPEPEIRKSKKSHESTAILQLFQEKCPPGGENAVVIYTTTLRGIRKTFEECNSVRSIIESYHIHILERDISMDSGYKEELRKLTETKEVKVPLVFVKGRSIGGVEEIVKLEEEGKLEFLFDGIPRAIRVCQGCGGVRFVMCKECNGSCKVLDGTQKKKMRCGECNENGLIQCPICC
ncbi:Glutaredoxin [Corchorus capsularis]|uniref:Glutaredoxin n=1 Tax=Corchorus capsularis TaxID=210143 RepID=A0A1R3II46_COCAP|nr:Glutaredoxin [Corchorus capsularis]